MRATVDLAASCTNSTAVSFDNQRELKSTMVRTESRILHTCCWYVLALAWISSAVSGGRVTLRPVGSPMRPVKSPIRKVTSCPNCWKARILLSSTVWPRCRSGAVGSKPALIRSGRPRLSFFSSSAGNSISCAPRAISASCSAICSGFMLIGRIVAMSLPRCGLGLRMDQQQLSASQFGSKAGNYLTSAVHATGADLERLATLAGQQRPARALDLGCGAGHASFALARGGAQRITAYDPAADMLAVVTKEAAARGHAAIETHAGAAEVLPFEDHTFELVVTRYSAHHWASVPRALGECERVLVARRPPGGHRRHCSRDAAARYLPAGDRVPARRLPCARLPDIRVDRHAAARGVRATGSQPLAAAPGVPALGRAHWYAARTGRGAQGRVRAIAQRGPGLFSDRPGALVRDRLCLAGDRA